MKTRGNILRADNGHDVTLPRSETTLQPLPGVPFAKWRRSSIPKADGQPLYYDLVLVPP